MVSAWTHRQLRPPTPAWHTNGRVVARQSEEHRDLETGERKRIVWPGPQRMFERPRKREMLTTAPGAPMSSERLPVKG